jgi:hypothetical protein
LNTEVTEANTKDLLEEAQDLRATVGRLSTEHARSIGWESRLRTAIQERDDFRQERDVEGRRARVAENRLVALGDKNGALHCRCCGGGMVADRNGQPNYGHRFAS